MHSYDAGKRAAMAYLAGPDGARRSLMRLAEQRAAERATAEEASAVQPVETYRIPSHPVRRSIRRDVMHSTVTLGRGVTVEAEMTHVPDGPRVVHGVWPLANGLTGVVLCIGYDPDECTSQWLASAGGPWLPETFDGLHQAVAAVLDKTEEAR